MHVCKQLVIFPYSQVIEGIDRCVHLTSLWLGKNKIEELRGIDHLVSLKQLDVQSNRLTSLG